MGSQVDELPSRMKGDVAYERAMRESSDLIHRIKEAGREVDVARSLTADIWSQADNIPFLTTVYQAVQEAKTGPEIRQQHERYIPFVINGHRYLRSP